MGLFDPNYQQPRSELAITRQLVIAELDTAAKFFRSIAAGARSEAVIISYTRCAEYLEGRIEAIRQGDQLHQL